MIIPRGVFTPKALTGGTAHCLDSIPIAIINHEAISCMFSIDGVLDFHIFDAYCTDATNSPSRIRPLDYNGSGCWKQLSSTFVAPTPNVATVGPYGQIFGGDTHTSGAHTVEVNAFSLMDFTNTVPIHTAVATPVTISSVASINYILAAVIESDGTHSVRPYPTIAAVAADIGTNITTFRLLDFAPTNSSGNVCEFVTIDGIKWLTRFSDLLLNTSTAPPAGITTAIDISTKIPVSLVSGLLLGAQAASAAGNVYLSGLTGTTQSVIAAQITNLSPGEIYEWGVSYDNNFLSILNNNIFWGKSNGSHSGTVQLAVHACKLRR